MSINDFGVLTFGTTLAGLLAVVAEFGFSLMAQKDIPQNKFNFNDYVFNTLVQKAGFSAITLIGGVIYLNLFYTGDNYSVGLIFILNAIVTSNIMYFFSVFRAKNMFVIESWLSLIYAIFSVLIVVLFYYYNLSVIFVAYSLLIVRVIQFVVLSIVMVDRFSIKPNFNKKINIYLFKNSYSYGLHYIIGVFYFTIDNQLLAYYSGNEALAIYQAMFKLVLILLAVNSLFETVFLPFLSSKFGGDKVVFLNMASLINKTIVILGLSIFLMFNLFVKDVVTFLYPEDYLVGLTITFALSLVLLFRIQTTVYSVLLTISNHQNMRVVTVAITLLTNIVLNFMLIPKYGFRGAATVSAITHFVMLILYVGFARKYINSFLIDLKTVLFSLSVILFFLVIHITGFELSYFYIFLVLSLYVTSLLLIFSKEQLIQVKRLVTGTYY